METIYQELLDNIPDYPCYLTAEEMDESSRRLAAKYPAVVSLFHCGQTKRGHPLQCLKIGHGSHNALLLGMPHPNEAVGAMLIEYLAGALAESEALRDALDYTWYMIKTWDMDGAKLNEGWLKGPFTLRNYARHFFRTPSYEQPDWTFPADYKRFRFHAPVPETEAAMELIDRIRPQFIYSLHNGGLGGVFWYLSLPTPELYAALGAVPGRYGLSIPRSGADLPYCETLAPAIYRMDSMKDLYDYLERLGTDMEAYSKDPANGENSAHYGFSRHGSFSLTTELPYFFDPRIGDDSPCGRKLREILLEKAGTEIAMGNVVLEILEDAGRYFSGDNRFAAAVRAYYRHAKPDAAAITKRIEADPANEREATVAEEFSNIQANCFYLTLYMGMLIRACEYELVETASAAEAAAGKKSALEKGRDRALAAFEKAVFELEEQVNYEVVPIKKLIATQLESGLLIAEHLKAHPELNVSQRQHD